MTRIVGWHLPPYDLCSCGGWATVMIEDNGDTYSCCQACVPNGTLDEIATVFTKALSQDRP